MPSATPRGAKRHSSLSGSRKPPSCAACVWTQSRWRPRICATSAARSRPTWPPGVRAASVSSSISSSGARATDIGAHLSQSARSRPPTTCRRLIGRSGQPPGRTRRRTRRGRGLGQRCPKLPAESGRFRVVSVERPAFCPAFSLQIGYICAELIALHTREVAGSKPAAPMQYPGSLSDPSAGSSDHSWVKRPLAALAPGLARQFPDHASSAIGSAATRASRLRADTLVHLY